MTKQEIGGHGIGDDVSSQLFPGHPVPRDFPTREGKGSMGTVNFKKKKRRTTQAQTQA